MLLLLTLTIYVIAPSSATLPSMYWSSTVKGKHEWWYDPNPNAYGCSTGEYSNRYYDHYYPKYLGGLPYCPNDKIEVHDDFSLVAGKARKNNKAWFPNKNTVSCMKCPASSYGSSTVSFTSGHLFRMVCDESVVGALKENFSDLLYGDNDFSFNADGTFSSPFSLGTDGLYQRWMLGADNERMTWTTHHDVICDGVCNLRYTLVTPTEQFGSASIGSVWWTSTNYYEVGEASCDIELTRF